MTDLVRGRVAEVVRRGGPAGEALVQEHDTVAAKGGVERERGVAQEIVLQSRDIDVQVVETAAVQRPLRFDLVVVVDIRVRPVVPVGVPGAVDGLEREAEDRRRAGTGPAAGERAIQDIDLLIDLGPGDPACAVVPLMTWTRTSTVTLGRIDSERDRAAWSPACPLRPASAAALCAGVTSFGSDPSVPPRTRALSGTHSALAAGAVDAAVGVPPSRPTAVRARIVDPTRSPRRAERNNGIDRWVMRASLVDIGLGGPYRGRRARAYGPSSRAGTA